VIAKYCLIFILIESYFRLYPFYAVRLNTDVSFQNIENSILHIIVQILLSMSLPGLTGTVLATLIHFSIKYILFYGVPSMWAIAVGINCPGEPHFIMSRCSFTDMWREFDKGLHIFLRNNVYYPITATDRSILNKVRASLLCFTVVYFWHGKLHVSMSTIILKSS